MNQTFIIQQNIRKIIKCKIKYKLPLTWKFLKHVNPETKKKHIRLFAPRLQITYSLIFPETAWQFPHLPHSFPWHLDLGPNSESSNGRTLELQLLGNLYQVLRPKRKQTENATPTPGFCVFPEGSCFFLMWWAFFLEDFLFGVLRSVFFGGGL